MAKDKQRVGASLGEAPDETISTSTTIRELLVQLTAAEDERRAATDPKAAEACEQYEQAIVNALRSAEHANAGKGSPRGGFQKIPGEMSG